MKLPRHLKPERREYMRRWLAAHPNYRRSRYLANRKRLLALGKLWVQNNRDKARETWRRYYRNKRSYHLGRAVAWKNRNPEKAKAYKSISGARRRSRCSNPSTDKRITALYKRCQELKRWFDVQVDHILPLSRGGRHEIGNLQIIYAFENNRKHTNPNYKPRIVFL